MNNPQIVFTRPDLFRLQSNALEVFDQLSAERFTPDNLAVAVVKLVQDTAAQRRVSLQEYEAMMADLTDRTPLDLGQVGVLMNRLMDGDSADQSCVTFDTFPDDAVPIIHSEGDGDESGEASMFQGSPVMTCELTSDELARLLGLDSDQAEDTDEAERSENRGPVFPWDNPVGGDSALSFFDQLKQRDQKDEDNDDVTNESLTSLAGHFLHLTKQMEGELSLAQLELHHPTASTADLCSAMTTCLNHMRAYTNILRGMVAGARAVDQGN